MVHAHLPRIICMFKVAAFGRLPVRGWAAVLVAVWLTQMTGSVAWGWRSIDYVSSDRNDNLEDMGRVVETDAKLKTTGRKRDQSRPSVIDEGVEMIIDLDSRDFSNLVLQPANNAQNASGSGLNINNDGTCIVGYQDSGQFTQFHAFRWTAATKAVDLGTLDPPNNSSRSSFATDTNQDCSVVVGFSDVTAQGAIQHAFRWTSGGMVDIGAPGGAGRNSRAFGVSSNGTVLVGDADFPAGAFTRKGAYRWTGGSFTDLIPGTTPSLATTVTADGTVVVGQMGTTTSSSAFRWSTQNPTAQPIGPLPGHTAAAATGVSDNGKIVVGISNPDFLQYRGPVLGWNQGIAFRWTQAKGIQDLRQILVDGGVDMTGITLVSVTGMSRDGQTIQGQATTPQTGPNETVAYVAHVCDDDIGGPCSTTGAAPFTLGATPTQLSVSAGNSATTTITVTPNAGFNQPVSFSCGNLPVGAACSFNPATVTPAGAPITTTLTITTNGGPVARLAPKALPTMFAYVLAPVGLLLIGGLWYRQRPDNHSLWMAVLLISVIAVASCSDSDSPPPATNLGGGAPATGTPAGTSNVTVTASSGSGNSTVPITLTVTR